MTDDDAFISAIQEYPDDDTPRLVYADWQDEHNQPLKAECLRLAVEARSRPKPAQIERLRQLREQLGTEWLNQVFSSRFDTLFGRVTEEQRQAEERQREIDAEIARAQEEQRRRQAAWEAERREREAEEAGRRLDALRAAGRREAAGNMAKFLAGTVVVLAVLVAVYCGVEFLSTLKLGQMLSEAWKSFWSAVLTIGEWLLISVGVVLGVLFGGAVVYGIVAGLIQAASDIARGK